MLIVQAKDNLLYTGGALQVFAYRAEHNVGTAFHRIAEYAGTDGRKSYACQLILIRQAQGGGGGAAQLGVFIAAAHNGTHGVDNVFGL